MKKDFFSLFTEGPSSLGLSEFKMRFLGEELEEEYLKDTQAQFLKRKKIGIILGIALFLVFGAIDFLLFEKVKGLIWFIRFALVMPLFSIILVFASVNKFKHYVRKIIPVLVILLSLSHLMALKYMPFSATSIFYTTYILLIIYNIVFMRTGFIASLIEMILMVVFYAFFVLFNENIEYMDKLIGGILVVSVCFIGVMFAYVAEYNDRKTYINYKKNSFVEGDFSLADFPFEEAIIFVDKDGNCKYISKQMENLIPHNKGSILNYPLSKIFSKKDKKRFEQSVKAEHGEPMLLEENFNVLNKSGASIPMKLTISPHVDHKFGEGFIIIVSNPELEYSSAKLLSNTQLLLRQKTEDAEKHLKQYKAEKAKAVSREKKGKKEKVSLLDTEDYGGKEEERTETQTLPRNPTGLRQEAANTDLRKMNKDMDHTKVLSTPSIEEPNLKVSLEQSSKKIQELEQEVKELKTENKSLFKDVELLRRENRELKDTKHKEIDENSYDNIKLMGRMASFVSSSLGKNFGENLNYLNENKEDINQSPYKNYLNIVENRVHEGLYLSGSVAMKFELFEQYLKSDKEKKKGVDVCKSLGTSISQMAKYFENTKHMVEVSCKEGIGVRMEEESFKLIIQNLVMNGLISATQLGKDALIELNVKDEKSKVILEYRDNGKFFPSYYREIIKLKELNSEVLSVNGIEFFFTKDLIHRECAGEVSFIQIKDGNKFRMVFMK